MYLGLDPSSEVNAVHEGLLVEIVLIHLLVQFLNVYFLVETIFIEPRYFLHCYCSLGLLEEMLYANVCNEGFNHFYSSTTERPLLSLKF